MSAASLSHGCTRGGAARRSSGCAAFNARRPVLPDGIDSYPRCRRAACGTLGLLPPPLWGRVGEGGGAWGNSRASTSGPPPPTPPHKGEGSTPSLSKVPTLTIHSTCHPPLPPLPPP